MLQDAWQEERITHDLIGGWTNKIRLIISGAQNEYFALGSVRECNPLGKRSNTLVIFKDFIGY
jgi:hypothetical protein